MTTPRPELPLKEHGASPTMNPLTTHRFEVRRGVVLPLGLALLAILVLAASTLTLPSGDQTHMVNLMLSCLCLLPMVVCLFPIYLGLMAAVFYLGKLNSASESRLQRVFSFSETLKNRTSQTTDTLNQRVLNLSVSLARFDPLLKIFDQRDTKSDEITDSHA